MSECSNNTNIKYQTKTPNGKKQAAAVCTRRTSLTTAEILW